MDLKELIRKYNFLIIIFMAYSALLFLHFNGLKHDWPTMFDNYYDVTLSIVKGIGLNKTEIFNECKSLFEQNQSLTLECKRHAFAQGIDAVYPTYPPGMSFLAVPYFFIVNLFNFPEFIELSSLVFFNILISMILMLYIFKFSRLYASEKSSKQIAYIFAFATIILTYSQTFGSDILGALLILSGFYYFSLFLMKKEYKNIAFSGLLFGYLFLAKMVLLVFPALIGLYLLFKDKKAALILGLCALLTALPGMVYNQLLFGSIIKTGYSAAYANFEIVDASFAGFSTNPLIGMWVVLFGIICYSPFLIYSLKNLIQKAAETRFILLFFIATLLLFGAWIDPFGNWCYGPRLELYMICLLSIPFAKNYEKIKKEKGFWALLIISIIIILMSQNFYFWDAQNEIMIYLSAFY
jgi:magnesium-transporting ATPase (P-type)